MGEFKSFFNQYKGAIIGFIFALLLIIFELDRIIIGIVILFLGMFFGNYIQRNKQEVKEKLKRFIDRM